MNAFVLAGGQSTRMGRDKALLEIGGRPLVVHMLELVRSLGLNARVCGSRPDMAQFAEVIPDNFPRCGPLAGIEAALAISDSELNLFVPIDTPGLPGEFLRWMTGRAGTSQAAATIPSCGGRPQPLCAVYSRRLQPGLRRSLAAADYKVMTALRAAAAALGEAIDNFHVECVAPVLQPGAWPPGSCLPWFRNLNTPTDIEQLAQRLERRAIIQ